MINAFLEKLQRIEWSTQELIVGGLIGLVYIKVLGFVAIFNAVCCGILFAMGGSKEFHKNWRRLGVPFVFTMLAWLSTGQAFVLYTFIPMWAVLTIGYGIPTFQGPGGVPDDKGSVLGRWIYYNLASQQEETATLYTRAVIAVLIAITCIPLGFINYTGWAIGSILLVPSFALFSIIDFD